MAGHNRLAPEARIAMLPQRFERKGLQINIAKLRFKIYHARNPQPAHKSAPRGAESHAAAARCARLGAPAHKKSGTKT